ncbi:MAG: Rv3235 family protein [Mycobacterium sp.]
MNISPVVGVPEAFAVLPVVDYEPPTQAIPRDVPACRQSSRAPLRRRSTHAPHRPYPPGRQPAAEPRTAMSAQMRQAAIFADGALRRVLEVIDRRRPAAQLRPLLTPSLVDSVVSVGHSAAGHAGAAVLRRMRVQPAGHRDPEAAAEVSGSYSRGNRIHAIACRVERVPTGAGARWLVVALHIG